MVAPLLASLDSKVLLGLGALAAFIFWQTSQTTANLATKAGGTVAKGVGTAYGDLKSSGGTAYRDISGAYGTFGNLAIKQGSDAKKQLGKAKNWLKRRF